MLFFEGTGQAIKNGRAGALHSSKLGNMKAVGVPDHFTSQTACYLSILPRSYSFYKGPASVHLRNMHKASLQELAKS